jgi:hypothetical protein
MINIIHLGIPIIYPLGVDGLASFINNITHLRIKQFPLANGHGRHITATPEWKNISVG